MMDRHQLAATCGVPDACGPVVRRRGDALAVWRPGHRADDARVSSEHQLLKDVPGFPYLHSPVICCGGKEPAVRRPRHPPWRDVTAAQHEQLAAAPTVPDPYGPVA